MFIEFYSLLVLSISIGIAYINNSIPYLPTEISRIVGTKPAYYFFVPATIKLSLLINAHLMESGIDYYLRLALTLSLIGLAFFDHYHYHTIHCICAFTFFSIGLIILYPHILIGIIIFICRLLLLPFQYLSLDPKQPMETNLIFKIRAILQWLLVWSFLASFSSI
jgi:hypothetical protein